MRGQSLPSGAASSRGFSLIELMLSITLGLLILAGLSSIFVNTSQSSRELRRTAEQIENGRYAVELMTQDLRHAGFYGELTKLPAVPASADPCTLPASGAVSDTSNAALALPIQVYPAAGLGSSDFASVPAACAALIPSPANLAPGSDIVVVRRADTVELLPLGTATAAVKANTVYIQTTTDTADIQKPGADGMIDNTQTATGGSSTLKRTDFTGAAPVPPTQWPRIAAAIRRYRTHVYFVAPCSVPNGGGSVCTGSADDLGKPIPTLKRLELDTTGAFSIVPLAEGIQAIRAELGVDSAPTVADAGTGLIGDAIPDSYTHSPSAADMGNTVAVRLYVLARNTEASPGYVDDKTYSLGTETTTATSDSFKRHVYGAETRIANQAGRREIPK